MSSSGPSGPLVSKSIFSKNSYRNIIRVLNRLDPDQTQHFVGPDLGPNCLQRPSADNTRRCKELSTYCVLLRACALFRVKIIFGSYSLIKNNR